MSKGMSKNAVRWTMFVSNLVFLALSVSVHMNLNKLQDKAPVLQIDDNFKMARGVSLALVIIFSIISFLNLLAIIKKY